MYSINVFLTFSLSMIGMVPPLVAAARRASPVAAPPALFAFGTVMCVSILG